MQESQIKDINQYIFYNVYGRGSKDNTLANTFFDMVKEYLHPEKTKYECIFADQSERKNILRRLTRDTKQSEKDRTSLLAMFLCEYGCVLLLRKNKRQSPIKLQIIIPEKWATNAKSSQQAKLQFCDPQSYSSIHLDQCYQEIMDLEKFYQNFKTQMEKAKRKIYTQNQQVQQPVKLQIEEVIKLALKKGGYNLKIQENKKEESQDQQDNDIQKVGQSMQFKQSKGSIAWSITQILLKKLLNQSQKQDIKNIHFKAQKLILGFKAYVLQKATQTRLRSLKQNQKCNRKQIGNFKLCLDQLIFFYKSNISIEKKNNIQGFQDVITKIRENIKSLSGGYLTSKISDSLKKTQSFQLNDPSDPTMKEIEQPDLQKQQYQFANIQDFKHEVDIRHPFQDLLELKPEQDKPQSLKNQWVLLVEKVMFGYTSQIIKEVKKNVIDFQIHMRQIQCEFGSPNICKLVLAYQQLVSKNDETKQYYGMGFPGQIRSHVELIKVIAAIIAFESVKMNRQKRNSNFKKFMIPNDVELLYSEFKSHSSKARISMNDVYRYYQNNKQSYKKQIFKLNDNDDTYQEIADMIGKDTRSAKVWLQNMNEIMKLEKQLKVKQVQLVAANNQIQGFKNQIFNARTNQMFGHSYLDQYKQYQNSTDISLPLKRYNEKKKYVFAFLNNIPPDILGLIKIILISQNPLPAQPLDQDTNLFTINNLFDLNQQDLPIKIFNKIEPQKQKFVKISSKHAETQISFLEPLSTTKILFNNSSTANTYSKFWFNIYPKQSQDLPQGSLYYISPPEDECMNREHTLYANLSKKPKQIQVQDFLAIGNVRVGQKTQLIVLLKNILQRKIISNSYHKTNLLAEQVILQTAGQLSAFHHESQMHFKSVQKIIKQFRSVWVFSDTNFCPIFGPIISYLMRELFYWQLVEDQQQFKREHFLLTKRCYDQFLRGQLQIKEDPNLKIQWDQRFICFATLSMFRQIQLAKEQSQQIMFLTQLIFQNRICKIMSDRQQKPKNRRPFETQLEFAIDKVIYNNIKVLSQYLYINHQHLNIILKKIDQSAPLNIQWQKLNMYSFKGTSEESKDIYQLDIYKGCIFKNGKEVSALDKVIKQNPYFQQIFGQDREFQVFPSHHAGYVKSKNNFNHQFKVNQNLCEIFFEFAQNGTCLRYIVNSSKQDEKRSENVWQLLPIEILQKSNIYIPSLYFQNYIAWYCKQKSCIVFRRRQFQRIHQIGLIVHLSKNNSKLKVQKAFLGSFDNGYEQQDLQQICSPDNMIFQKVKLRSKVKKNEQLKPYQIFKRFEDPKYIFELQNQKTNAKSFWLHRHKMKFTLSQDNKRLISQSHYGYEVDFTFYEDELCLFNKFQCLVLKKTNDKQTLNMTLNNNERILIVSEGKIDQNGKIIKYASYQQNKKSKNIKIGKNNRKKYDSDLIFGAYKYEIHDFFGDLRGSNRQSQLHMAAIMLSINNNMKIQSIQMTPLQYAVYLMKTCITNRPFKKSQFVQLRQIIQFANDQILLLSQCLWTCSQKLRNILPFAIQKDYRGSLAPQKQKLLKCKTLYEKRHGNNCIRYLEKLPEDLLNYIELKIKRNKKNKERNEQKNSSDSSEESANEAIKQEYFWKNFPKFQGQNIVEQYNKVLDKFNQFKNKSAQIQKWWSSTQNLQQIQQQFPKQIQEETVNNPEDQMMKQMIEQLKSSHHTFVNQQHKIKSLVEKLRLQTIKEKIIEFKELIKLSKQCIQIIEKNIQNIKKENENHPQIICGIRPTLTPTFYTSILCEPQKIYLFYPDLTNQRALKLKEMIKIWIFLKTRTSSLERCFILLQSRQQNKIDIVALLRQILSPRQEVFKRQWWLCFEAQMKIQLWPSQLETYKNLMEINSEEVKNQIQKNPFCQLNMGEGKTQTIIPMMILNLIYGKQKKLPRINILSSLFEQANNNFFKFLSATGFQIPGFEIPFKRTVELNKKNIFKVRHLINNFKQKSFVLMTRQSKLSQILKYREVGLKNKISKAAQQSLPLFNVEVFDIFDQIDAMMTAKRSYIFSIGEQIQLFKGDIRQDILRLCLEIFFTTILKQFLDNKTITSDQKIEDALNCVQKGQFPLGLRYILENTEQQTKIQIRRKIAQVALFQSQDKHYFSFVSRLTQNEKEDLIKYVTQVDKSGSLISSKVGETSRSQIYILRGALAYGIFEHCLSMRHGVQFGAPNQQHIKRIAVPYEAADIPSKTSEYQHPDVSIILSYISYYARGLTYDEFQKTLQILLGLTDTSKEVQYEQWIKILDKQSQQNTQIKKANQINMNSKAMIQKLYDQFKKNRRAISFWLIKEVFPRDLKQYNQSICSSAWELADVKSAIGFSGTKDNRWIFSDKLLWKPCESPSIKGTDGKMITLIRQFTNQVCLIEENDDTLWKRFLQLALQKKVGCVIDAGALCVGKSLKNQIVPWVAQHKSFDNEKYLGVSFCDQNGKWQVYDIESKYYINRGTTIPDNHTFVIFDQARTRGADLKMNEDVVAALSLGPDMTKDKLMQAAGRLRKLGRNQSLILMGTHEVYSYIKEFPKDSEQIKNKIEQTNKQELTNKILAWCCRNSIHQNQQLLLQFASLGWKYIYSKVKKQTHKQQIISKPEDMYKNPLHTTTVAQYNQAIYNGKDSATKQYPTSKYILQKLSKYGRKVKKQAGSLDNVCQREIQAQKQKQKQQQNGLFQLQPIKQIQKPNFINKLQETSYIFDSKFKMSENFLKTTKVPSSSKEKILMQLPECYFVKFNHQSLQLISLREASLFIKLFDFSNLQYQQQQQSDQEDQEKNMQESNEPFQYQIQLLKNLSINHKLIKRFKLQDALVNAFFVSGRQNYTLKEEKFLLNMFTKSLNDSKNIKNQDRYIDLVSTILKRRRVYLKRFSGSTLQKSIIALTNQEGKN